jgi:hypothetical protein
MADPIVGAQEFTGPSCAWRTANFLSVSEFAMHKCEFMHPTAIFDEPSRSLSPTIIANGIIKDWAMNYLRAAGARVCRSHSPAPTARWLAQLLRTSSVRHSALGFGAGTGHYGPKSTFSAPYPK